VARRCTLRASLLNQSQRSTSSMCSRPHHGVDCLAAPMAGPCRRNAPGGYRSVERPGQCQGTRSGILELSGGRGGLCPPLPLCLRPFVRVGGVPREVQHALAAIASTVPVADVLAGELRLSREERLHDLSGHVVAPILAAWLRACAGRATRKCAGRDCSFPLFPLLAETSNSITLTGKKHTENRSTCP